MAVVLDAAPASATANSYATVADADAYLATQLYAEAWATTDPDTKARALITATRLLDDNVTWRGTPFTATQALGLPRSSLPARSGWGWLAANLIPSAARNATAELARQLVEAGQLPDTPADVPPGVKKIKASSVEIEFDGSAVGRRVTFLPEGVFQMIAFLVESSSVARTCVPLTRA